MWHVACDEGMGTRRDEINWSLGKSSGEISHWPWSRLSYSKWQCFKNLHIFSALQALNSLCFLLKLCLRSLSELSLSISDVRQTKPINQYFVLFFVVSLICASDQCGTRSEWHNAATVSQGCSRERGVCISSDYAGLSVGEFCCSSYLGLSCIK